MSRRQGRHGRIARALGATAILALIVSACGSSTDAGDSSNSGSDQSESQDSGQSNDDEAGDQGDGEPETLVVNTSFVLKGLDPGTVYEGTGNMIVHALYDTLVTFEGSDISDPQPALAKTYEASPDGKTFTFHLDPTATFGDGSPVTSADVVFSLNRLKNLKGSAAPIVDGLTFSAPDDMTVVVTSDRVNPNVPMLLAAPYAGILNADVAKANGGTAGTDAITKDTLGAYLSTHSIGSGPYDIESFDSASRVVLTADPDFWGQQPEFDRVVISNMEVQNQHLTMMKGPDNTVALDLAGSSLSGLPESLHISGSADTYYQLRLHADPAVSKVTSNRDWVAALRAALDYEGIAKLFGKSGVPAAGMIPPAYAGALPTSDAQQQELATAKTLLAESGVGDQSVGLLYPAITYLGVDLGTIAAKIQSDAAKAGIKITLEPAPIASFLEQRKTGKVALSFSPQSLDYPAAVSIVADVLPGGHTAQASGWTAERADDATVAAGEAALTATDAAKQVAKLKEWQRLMIENGPYITICYSSHNAVSSANLDGATYTAAGWIVDLASITSN